jgi:hypothetical protein
MNKILVILILVVLSATAIGMVPSDVIQQKNSTVQILDLSGVTVDFNSSAFVMEPLGTGKLNDEINNTAELGNNSTGTPSGLVDF